VRENLSSAVPTAETVIFLQKSVSDMEKKDNMVHPGTRFYTTPVHQKWTICKKMDKENGLHFVTDGFTPASAGFNGLQRASLRF